MENNYNNNDNIFGGNTGEKMNGEGNSTGHNMDSNMNGNMDSHFQDNGTQESTENPVPSSTGAPGSIYSYSYVNQENQERNPNYYERQEESSANAQRTYTTGSYGNSQEGSRTYTAGSYGNAQEGAQSYTAGSYENAQEGAQAFSTGTAEQTPRTERAGFYKKKEKKEKTPKEKKQHGFGMTVAKCAALALVFGLVSGTVFYGTGFAFRYTAKDTVAKPATENAENASGGTVNSGSLPITGVSTATTVTDVSDIAENVMPSIVSIANLSQQKEMDFFGRTYVQETPSEGSGIIIAQTDEEIFIATNNHVVADSSQLTVNFIDDQQVTAEIKGTDASTDLAVVSVKVKDIPSDTMDKIKVATLGNSEGIKVGQSVVAIGNALGYGQSVTTGVISAVEREVTVQDPTTGATITNDLIQTDAAINPGNSGGALLNMNGEVVGINSVKYSDTQVEGMGYSIPISAAEPIINDLITKEVVDESNSSYLGVSGQDVTSELSESFGMPEGVYITMVAENSAAEQAGIRKGDVITSFAGRKVTSMEGLSDIMQYYAAGTEVEVALQTNQNGEWVENTVKVKLGKKND